MKKAHLVFVVLAGLVASGSIFAADAVESTKLQHAVYVVFQAPGIFTPAEIETAQKHIRSSAATGDALAKLVTTKLDVKFVVQATAQR